MALNCAICYAFDQSNSFADWESITTRTSQQPMQKFLKERLNIVVNRAFVRLRMCPRCVERLDSLDAMLIQSQQLIERIRLEFDESEKQYLHFKELEPKPQSVIEPAIASYEGEQKVERAKCDEHINEIQRMADENSNRPIQGVGSGNLNNAISKSMEDVQHYCNICGLRYKSKIALNYHTKLKHTADSNKSKAIQEPELFFCETCARSYKSKTALNGHIKAKHALENINERPVAIETRHVCGTCGSSYKMKGALNFHIKNKHSAQNQFVCKTCNKVFAQKFYLKIHQRIHSGESIFQCDVCGKGFIHRGSYIHHTYSHTDTRPYKCSFCDKRFRSKIQMRRHERFHTGEKPYACPVCDQRFAQRYNMTVHFRAMHGSKGDNAKLLHCLICLAKFDQKQKLEHHLREVHLTVPTITESSVI